MADDRSHDEYHLTPNGWVAGTSYFLNAKLEDKTVFPPSDRVETWARDMTQLDPRSPEQVSWWCMWISADHSEEHREALRKKYGKPYRDFPGTKAVRRILGTEKCQH